MAGLFGNRQAAPGIGQTIGNLLLGSNEVEARRVRALQEQQRALAAQDAATQRMNADRLRAQLSPADGPNGSGTGALPSQEEVAAALYDAQLKGVDTAPFAEAHAGLQRQQQAGSLFGSNPLAQSLYRMGNQSFLDSLGEQFKPQVIAAGGRQSVIGEGKTVDAPSFSTVNDTVIRNDPGAGTTTPTFTAPPAYSDVTQRVIGQGNLNVAQGRLGLDRSQAGFTLGQGQTRYGLDGQPIAAVQAAPSAQNSEIQGQIQSLDTDVDPTLGQMQALITSGDVITGIGADLRLNAARALAASGNADAQRQVAATQQYQNLSGRLRVGMAKSLGANPSNADIALLEKITAGNISQSPDALAATIRDGQAMAARQRQALQGRVQGQAQQGGSVSGPIAQDAQGNRVQWNGSAWVPM